MKQDRTRLTKAMRDELIALCTKTRKLTAEFKDPAERVQTLNYAAQQLLYDCDKATRTYIYSLVDTLLDSEQSVKRESYLTPSMVIAFNRQKPSIKAGAMTKKIVDNFIRDLSSLKIDPVDKSEIYRVVILRLLMELSADQIDDMLQHIAPNASSAKVTNESRHMYG